MSGGWAGNLVKEASGGNASRGTGWRGGLGWAFNGFCFGLCWVLTRALGLAWSK